jgi:c-di-GMP-binding flagellar brake protein YcgR
MLLTVVIIIIAVVGGIGFLVSSQGKGKSASWLQFYAKGKDSGFSIKEIELLRQLAVQSDLEDPSSLFWSQKQLDLCIRSLIKDVEEGSDQDGHDFLAKLYDFRKKIEMNKPKNKNGLDDSRQISDGQNLQILVKGTGVFKSEILKNASQYITISRPVSNKQYEQISWTGKRISVYFWREDDAGYVFDTDVVDEVFSKGYASLKINHPDTLYRTQKRKSIRVKLHKSAYIYQLSNDEDIHRPEINPGLKCFLEDLCDSGCAITIGGKATEGLRIKVQFTLNNNFIVMPGTVRSVNYQDEQDRSLLHIEAEPLPIEVRNQILGEVFGLLPEEEQSLPFSIQDEDVEALNIGGQPSDEENVLEMEGI